MGIHDRDYYRDDSNGFLDAWGRMGASIWLIVITCAVFFAQMFTSGPRQGDITHGLAFIPQAVLEGEVWRLITSLFLHSDLWALFWNMLVLYWAGSRLEEMYGAREFLAYYLLSGVLANAAGLLAFEANPAIHWANIGASGPVAAVLVLYAAHFPHQQILLFFVLPMRVWVMAVLFVGLNIFFFGPGVVLVGAVLGLLYRQCGIRITGLFSQRIGLPIRRGPRLRVVRPEPEPPEPVGAAVETQPPPKASVDEHLEATLDRILEKVSRHGQGSLTAEEHEILVRASELYKKRRK